MSNVYIISDCHFGHKNICNFRDQFSTLEEHNEFLINKILSTVGKRDTLWMLGDMFFTRDALMNYGEKIRKSVGYSHLILGNHCSDSGERKENVGQMWSMFDSVHGLATKKGCWLSHAPIHESELRGKRNIHGHTHSVIIPDKRYFNACCENINYTPVNIRDILDGYMGELWDDL